MRCKIIEPAELELNDAYEYYENELKGLGDRFIMSFRSAVNRILQYPEAWTLIEGNVRKCLLDTFPYYIIYAVSNDFIVILSIAHQHRKPDYWIDRLDLI